MTPRDDRFPNMLSSTQFDSAIEQVLGGDAIDDDAAPLARFVDDLRVMADRPPPPPSPELAALLAGSDAQRVILRLRTSGGVQTRSTSPRSRRSPAAIRLRVAVMGLTGKAAMLLVLATTAVAGAATGLLPQPATQLLRRAIEVVTPFELPATGEGALADDDTGADAGDDVAAASPSDRGPKLAADGDRGTIRTLESESRAAATAPLSPVGEVGTAVDVDVALGDSAEVAAPTQPPSWPTVDDPADASPPADDQHTHPALGSSGHVPPGSVPSDGPHGDGSDSVDTPLMDRGGQDPSPAPRGPPAEPGSTRGPPSEPDGHGSHDARPARPAPVQDPPRETSPSEPGLVPGPGPSPDGGSDHAPCDPCTTSGAAPPRPDNGPRGGAPAGTAGGPPAGS